MHLCTPKVILSDILKKRLKMSIMDFPHLLPRLAPGMISLMALGMLEQKLLGTRAAGEIDMAKDRWIENPEPLAISIMATVKTSVEGVHRKEYQETKARAQAAAEV